MKKQHTIRLIVASILVTFLVTPGSAIAQQATNDTNQKVTKAGTTAIWGTIDGVAIEGAVEGPSTETTPLQVACVFEYTEGDIFNSPPALPAAANGMVHLDQALSGIITEIRKSGQFTGHAFETLLITPPPGAIPAGKLLLIGLGDRTKFTPELMITIAGVAMREALKLGVSSFAFASDLKDAGVDSPTKLVAGYEVKGAFAAYRTQVWLKSKKMSDFKPLTKMSFLAGQAFFTTAGEGIKEAIATFNK
jgi:hypothetical protein